MFKIICVLVHSCINSFWVHFVCFFLLMKKMPKRRKTVCSWSQANRCQFDYLYCSEYRFTIWLSLNAQTFHADFLDSHSPFTFSIIISLTISLRYVRYGGPFALAYESNRSKEHNTRHILHWQKKKKMRREESEKKINNTNINITQP